MPEPEHLQDNRRIEKIIIPVSATEKQDISEYTNKIDPHSRAGVCREKLLELARADSEE